MYLQWAPVHPWVGFNTYQRKANFTLSITPTTSCFARLFFKIVPEFTSFHYKIYKYVSLRNKDSLKVIFTPLLHKRNCNTNFLRPCNIQSVYKFRLFHKWLFYRKKDPNKVHTLLMIQFLKSLKISVKIPFLVQLFFWW
jgi:hypothetical protein